VKLFPEGSRLLLLAPIPPENDRTIEDKIKVLAQQGFSRVKVGNEVKRIDELEQQDYRNNILLVIDRIITRNDEDFYHRLADAVEMAFFEGKGTCFIEEMGSSKHQEFNNRFEEDGMLFMEPNIHLFSFNNPYGACPRCEGHGDVIGIDEDLVIPNTELSVYDNAIFPWRGDSMSWYRDQLVKNAYKFDFPIHRPWFELSDEQKRLVWTGNQYFEGLNDFFAFLESKSYKIQNRVMLSRYRGKTKCTVCRGTRLRPEAAYVKINGVTIQEVVQMPLKKAAFFFQNLELNDYEQNIA